MTDMEIDPRLEKIVWRSLGLRSVRQISEETGLAPEQIFAIKREMLDSVDVLTVQEKRTKILVAMEQLAQDALDRADGASDEFAAGMLNAARGAMKDMLTEFNRASKQDQAAVDSLNALRVKELVSLVQEVVDISVIDVVKRYDLDKQEVFDIFNSNLAKAAQKRDEIA